MKKYSNIIFCLAIILVFNNNCIATPLSGIISFFQRDFVVNVLYTDHKNLIQGSEVYLAKDPMGQKILIGKVSKVSLIESHITKIEIIIGKKYKEKLFETTPFVLMSGLFSKNSNSYIVAVSSLEKSNGTPLSSGSSITGDTFLEYKIATAGEGFKKMLGSIKKQNHESLNQLEQYIENFDSEAFQKKMDDLINKLSKFSAEQKDSFKKEILPELKNLFNSMMEKLNEQNHMEKSKELEKKLMEIEDAIDV